MTDTQTLLVALGVPALLGFPVWVARYMMVQMRAELREQTRLLTILVERMGGDSRARMRSSEERRDEAA